MPPPALGRRQACGPGWLPRPRGRRLLGATWGQPASHQSATRPASEGAQRRSSLPCVSMPPCLAGVYIEAGPERDELTAALHSEGYSPVYLDQARPLCLPIPPPALVGAVVCRAPGGLHARACALGAAPHPVPRAQRRRRLRWRTRACGVGTSLSPAINVHKTAPPVASLTVHPHRHLHNTHTHTLYPIPP